MFVEKRCKEKRRVHEFISMNISPQIDVCGKNGVRKNVGYKNLCCTRDRNGERK
jgi:hypothetical protein